MDNILLIIMAVAFFFLFQGSKGKPKDSKDGKDGKGGKDGDKVGKK